MQRHEIVKEAIRVGIPINVTEGDLTKYWTIEDQEHAIAKTEMQIGLVTTAMESIKTLLEHKYPVDLLTDEMGDVDVSIQPPEYRHVGLTVKLSRKITAMVNNLKGRRWDVAPRKDTPLYLSGVVDVLNVKLAAEKQHLAFLNEEV